MTEVQNLASFVAQTRFADLSDDAVAELKIRVLDTLGVAIGALDRCRYRLGTVLWQFTHPQRQNSNSAASPSLRASLETVQLCNPICKRQGDFSCEAERRVIRPAQSNPTFG